MAKSFGPFNRLETKLGLRVDPGLVLASHILQLTQPELEQAIEAELNDNPALERLQDDLEPISDETILRSVAPNELKPSSEDGEYIRSLPNDSEDVDWVDLTPDGTTLGQHLRAQLGAMTPAWMSDLAEYVAESVNEKGYLTVPAEEIALATNYALEDVELVIEKLKTCEPAGVGAFDVQECLLLQLRDAETLEEKLARKILRDHMDEFLAGRTARIVRRYRVMPEVVEEAFEVIKGLNPFPGEGFAPSSTAHQRSRSLPAVTPDLTIHRTEHGWFVEVRGADPNSLTIERAYRKRYEQLRAESHAPKDEKQHISQYVRRAASFIQAIHQRRRTLRRIGEYLLQHQAGFVSTGEYQFLRSLTRTQLAKDLGIHESTVSRATMGKFVQIANGEVVAFEVFFKPALRVQKMIEEILATENPNNPLSDEAIAQILEKQGVKVARRTVNKYRDRTRLLSSRKRRSA